MARATDETELRGPALQPPRFSLRTLWLAMTALCCLFAVMTAVGLLWSAVLALFLSLIVAHVAGNSLGTKLRDETNRQIVADRPHAAQRLQEPVQVNVAAPRQLVQRERLHRITLLMTVGGALIGAEGGGLGLSAIYPEASAAAVALGVISSGVLGGFAGFLTSSFLSVVRQALAEAHQGGNRNHGS